ncbi:hypothetical protein EYF80_027908 [Liparis tanakae]|uniref:Uncharacterized protein n=1 Tax=Liparis tanakae TaxID=230148 RepID=A0A4Z2HAS6_9TELE|nr:hypothetical protein EYF80_027908 [Liparis tanakae]
MESQGIPVRMEKPALMDHLASQEPQGTLDQQEQRETVERVSLAPGDSLDLRDPQEPDTDLLLWTWKALGSPTWTPSGDRLVYPVLLVPPAPPVLLVPRQREQLRVLGRSDHQERTGRPVNLACLVCRVWMDAQELLVPMEKRVIQALWVFQELSERRDLEGITVYREPQDRTDWLVCPGLWDQLGNQGLRGPPDQAIVLDLMTWRPLVEGSAMDCLVSQDPREDRVKPGCLVYPVRRAATGSQEEMDIRGWTASLDLRVKRVEMEQASKGHPGRLDQQDKSSTGHLTTEELVYLAKLDSLVQLDQRVTEGTPAFQATGERGRKVNRAW